MFDVALAGAGGQVALSSSCDENHPPENIIDGKPETFWSSTGLFPQEFVLTFTSLMNVNSVRLMCFNIKSLTIERSTQHNPTAFEFLEEKDLEHLDGQLQSVEFNFNNTTALHMKFTIESAYSHFVSVHNVHVDGNAVHN